MRSINWKNSSPAQFLFAFAVLVLTSLHNKNNSNLISCCDAFQTIKSYHRPRPSSSSTTTHVRFNNHHNYNHHKTRPTATFCSPSNNHCNGSSTKTTTTLTMTTQHVLPRVKSTTFVKQKNSIKETIKNKSITTLVKSTISLFLILSTLTTTTTASVATAASTTTATLPSSTTKTLASLLSTDNFPLLPLLTLTSTLPTLLGFYKSEYGVSYGYGLAISLSSLLALLIHLSSSTASTTSLVYRFHPLVTLFYGIRLTLFLLYREISIPVFRKFRERIEDRAKQRGNRLKRLPFVLMCSLLYGCMAAPLFVLSLASSSSVVGVSGVAAAAAATTNGRMMMTRLYECFVGLSFGGFLLNAIGDITKTIAKQKKEDMLVTSGVYRFFRHPNYTGEQIGWTFHFFAGIAALLASSSSSPGLITVIKNPMVWAGLLGWMGIEFVLGMATASLETRQREKYGHTEEYKEWVKRSWAGFKF